MTPDRYEVSLNRITEVVARLRLLDIPADRVHSLSVHHWSNGTVVSVHIGGEPETAIPLVDRIAVGYGLSEDAGDTANYSRGESLGETPVLVYCGRPE